MTKDIMFTSELAARRFVLRNPGAEYVWHESVCRHWVRVYIGG